MNWQEPVALGIVIVTTAIFAAGWWRRRQARFGRPGGCGNCAAPSARPADRIIFRARRGERPQIIIRPNPGPPQQRS